MFDTRNPDGAYGGPAISGTLERVFVLAGQCNIPSTAAAVSANVAVTGQTSGGHLTIHPPGSAMPVVSAINFNPLQTRANNAILPLGASGDIAVYGGLGTS